MLSLPSAGFAPGARRLPDALSALLTPELTQRALVESQSLRASLAQDALERARRTFEIALRSVAQVSLVGGAAAGDDQRAASQRALLRAMTDDDTVTDARVAAASPPFLSGMNRDAVPVEALGRFSLLRETAAGCELDAAARCIPLVAQLAAHARRSSAAAAAAAATAASADPAAGGRSSDELPAPMKRQRTDSGPVAEAAMGQQSTPPAAAPAAEEPDAHADKVEKLQLFGAVMSVARWGETTAVRFEAERQCAAWEAALERLRVRADAAAAWIETCAAGGAAAA